MKGDLISRQAAIDAVAAKALKGVFVEYEDVAEMIINKVPSAQPDHNELNFKCDGCYYYGKTTGSCTLCARYYPDLYENRRKEI